MTKTAREVKLGNVVRDVVTGVQGTAVQYLTLLNGSIQFGVQPKVTPKEPDKIPEAWNIDDNQLAFVDEGLEGKVVPPPEVAINLGDKVRDKITNLVGVTILKAVFINGCVYFSVQGELTDKKAEKPPEPLFLSHDRLEVIKPAFIAPPATQTSQPQAQRPPGGPTTRANRMS